MRVFVAGATGALGRHLVPGLVAEGHEVTATTKTPAKVARLREAGAEPVVVDGLDREAVIAAVLAAAPEVIVHQMTALADLRSLRKVDQGFAATNELRTRGTDNLLAAAARAGTRRVIAQSNAGMYERSGGPVKTEEDPLASRPPSPSSARSLAAIKHVDTTVPLAAPEGIVLRYGGFYGPGTGIARGGDLAEMVAKGRFPVVGDGGGVWSLIHVE
ncbi:MAG TPA: NAD(P)-dependent oxidoreductase, partial [Propionibacteriaceae bacterium]|nr:NAD(P)-dependent oxidoreductase [Propionibacteriaceae bacterium]